MKTFKAVTRYRDMKKSDMKILSKLIYEDKNIINDYHANFEDQLKSLGLTLEEYREELKREGNL